MTLEFPAPPPRLIRALAQPAFQLAASLAALGVIVFYASALFLFPATCGVWAQQGEITGLDAGARSAGLRPGDRLLAIGGRPYDRWFLSPPFPMGLRPGDTLLFEVQRDGRLLSIPVPTTAAAADPGFAPLVGLLILSLFLWACGLVLCLFAPPGDVRPRLVGLLWLVMGAGVAAGGPGQAFSFWGATTATRLAWSILGMVAITAHLYFPRPLLPPRALRTTLTALSGLALALLLLTLLDDGFSKPVWQRSLGSHLAVYPAAGLSILASLALLLRNRFLEPDAGIRRQTGIVFLGSALGFGPFLVLTFLPSLLGAAFVPASLTIPFLALIPLAYAYVLYQRQLLRVDVLINRMVVLFILFLAVLLLTFSLLSIAGLFLPLPAGAPIIAAVTAASAALPSALVLNKAQAAVNRILYGTHYDHASIAGALSMHLARALDRQTLTRLLTGDLAQKMGIRQAALFLAEGEQLRQAGAEAVVSLDEEVHTLLLGCHTPLPAAALWGRLSEDGRAQWGSFAWGQLAVPIVFEKRLYGLLLLGSRLAGEVYSEQDVRILATVAHQAALATDHIHLVESLHGLSQQLVRAGENERRQVARDLHDGVLQNLCFIRQQIRRDPELAGHVDDAINLLRRTIKAQRPPGLERGLAAALSDLVEDMRRLVSDSGVSIRWNGPGCDVSLPDEQATALYRIAQESIANAARHARAYLILVSLHCEAHRLVLTVEDDGTGMPPGSPLRGTTAWRGCRNAPAWPAVVCRSPPLPAKAPPSPWRSTYESGSSRSPSGQSLPQGKPCGG